MRRILWTGGFDSTWLLVDALLAGHRVETVIYRGGYAPSDNWQKSANEDEARRRIISALPSTLAARLGQVRIEHGLPSNAFHEPWWRLREHAPVEGTCRYAVFEPDGSHYIRNAFPGQDWLVGAIPAALPSPVPLETAYVGGDSVARKQWRKRALESLGLAFPLLDQHRTKQDLLADARKRGFAHLLDMTWSCEAGGWPRTEPCGECAPCKLRIIPQIGHAFEPLAAQEDHV